MEEVYTLDPNFLEKDVIDNFSSIIWTERYDRAGDVQLAIKASQTMANKLSPGTFLSIPDSNEVMIIETHSTENGLLTVTGPSLLGFLANTAFREYGQGEATSIYFVEASSLNVDAVMRAIVHDSVMADVDIDTTVGMAVSKQNLPNLGLEITDTSPPYIDIAVPFGTTYDALTSVADLYHHGMTLYLESATPAGFSLKFKAYAGVDRTSDQTINPVILFSPYVDTLTGIKELASIATFKNVCYMYISQQPEDFDDVRDWDPTSMAVPPGLAYADAVAQCRTVFTRRVHMAVADSITPNQYNNNYTQLIEKLNQLAANELINHNFVRVVEGQAAVSPNGYKFGVDYGMGDIVEIQGLSGFKQPARVVEYIRTKDASGSKEYPSFASIGALPLNGDPIQPQEAGPF